MLMTGYVLFYDMFKTLLCQSCDPWSEGCVDPYDLNGTTVENDVTSHLLVSSAGTKVRGCASTRAGGIGTRPSV